MRYFNPGFTIRPPLVILWNQNDKTSNVSLSSTLLTATGASSGDGGVRATKAWATGKRYCEVNMDTNAGGDTALGLANSVANLSTMGAASAYRGIMIYRNGNLCLNGILRYWTGNNMVSIGGIMQICYDADNHRVWLKLHGQSNQWNNGGTADPATGVGGEDVSAIDSAGLFPTWLCGATSDVAIANFGASSFTYAVPAGFSAWNIDT